MRNTGIYRYIHFTESSIYSGRKSTFQSLFNIKMAMGIQFAATVVGDSHITLIKPAIVMNIW